MFTFYLILSTQTIYSRGCSYWISSKSIRHDSRCCEEWRAAPCNRTHRALRALQRFPLSSLALLEKKRLRLLLTARQVFEMSIARAAAKAMLSDALLQEGPAVNRLSHLELELPLDKVIKYVSVGLPLVLVCMAFAREISLGEPHSVSSHLHTLWCICRQCFTVLSLSFFKLCEL